MLKVEADLSFAAAMAGVGDKLAAAIEKGLDRGADITVRAMDKQIGKTYKRPSRYSYRDPETGRKIKRKWQRSGDLAKSLDVKKSVGEREIISVGPAAKPIKNYPGGYAEKLRTLPVSKDGVARANDYPATAAKIIKPQVQRAVEQEVKNALGN